MLILRVQALSGDFGPNLSSSQPSPGTLPQDLQPPTANQHFEQPNPTGPSPGTCLDASMPASLIFTFSSAWQTAERASIRLVARDTAKDTTATQQPRYPAQGYLPYHAPAAIIFSSGPPPVLPPPQKGQKRRAGNTEVEPQAKKAKPKAKVKAAAEGSASTGRERLSLRRSLVHVLK